MSMLSRLAYIALRPSSRHLNGSNQVVVLSAKSKASDSSSVGRRHLGWLFGPNPEYGTKEWYYKWNRISAVGLVLLFLFNYERGVHEITIFDEDGNFAPKWRNRSPVELEMEEAQKKLQEAIEAEQARGKRLDEIFKAEKEQKAE